MKNEEMHSGTQVSGGAMMMDGMSFGMGLFGLLTFLIFWGGLLALAIWLTELLFPTPQKPQDHLNSGEK
ncbi:MAG: hypothetical protein HYR94_23715 [Chloroflexi bacterium]|nr:hypothetical protein [Chloroflexota bacterium]